MREIAERDALIERPRSLPAMIMTELIELIRSYQGKDGGYEAYPAFSAI